MRRVESEVVQTIIFKQHKVLELFSCFHVVNSREKSRKAWVTRLY